MTINDVEVMIGKCRKIQYEELMNRLIQKYDTDASYQDAYLVVQNELEGNVGGDVYLILDYGTSFTVIDVDGNSITYDEDDVSEEKVDIELQKISDYFEDCEYDDRFYTKFKPLWTDIYYTIEEYGLDRDKFLREFYTKDGVGVDYDVVEFFKRCLERGEIKRFITGNY